MAHMQPKKESRWWWVPLFLLSILVLATRLIDMIYEEQV